MNATEITATQLLMDHGIRPSVQRLAIMQYLLDHHTHPTVDVIYNDLQPSMPTLSRTTVYNTLQLLQQHNAVMALTIDSHTVHYDGTVHPHAHFMCRCCGRIIDLPLDQGIPRNPFGDAAFKIEQIQVNYYGVCDACRKQQSEAENN